MLWWCWRRMQCDGDQDPGQCVGRGTLSSPSRPLHCCPLPCPASTIQPQLSRAPHILTLTQIIFQHCTTPRTHTQPSPSTSNWNCSVSGWRLGDEAIFHASWRTINFTDFWKVWLQQFSGKWCVLSLLSTVPTVSTPSPPVV